MRPVSGTLYLKGSFYWRPFIYILFVNACRVPVRATGARAACVSRRCRAGARALRGAVEGTVGLDLRSYLYVQDGVCVH